MSYYAYEETKLYYEEIGEGIPFLLIHGWAIDHRFLEKALECDFARLSDCNFRRIYVDVPGMGLSEPGKVKNSDGIIEVLMHFMEDNYPGQKFYVGGNSFGGALSIGIAAKFPKKILGVLLIAPAAYLNSTKRVSTDSVKDTPEEEAFLATLTQSEQDDFTCMNAVHTKESYERYVSDIVPSVEINRENEFLHKKLKGTFGFDMLRTLEKSPFSGPALIVTGKCDTAVGYETQFEWLKLFPKATYIAIDRAGHNVHTDQPAIFHGVVGAWLQILQ